MLRHYDDSQDYWLTVELFHRIEERFLGAYNDCFEPVLPSWWFISEKGRRLLKDEQPGIWKEFSFEAP